MIEKLTAHEQVRFMDLRVFVPTTKDAILLEKVEWLSDANWE